MTAGDADEETITPRVAEQQGRVHAGFWLRALWLAEALADPSEARAPARSASRAPDYAGTKLLAYLAYIVSPPNREAETFGWRIAADIQVGPAICWLASELRGARILPPDILIDGAGSAIQRELGSPHPLAVRLRTIAEAFAPRRDPSFTNADIRADMLRNLRERNAGVLLTHEALAHPERHPDLLSPPAV